jgi:hypothetical protein
MIIVRNMRAARAPERAVLPIDETKDRVKVLMYIFHEQDDLYPVSH